MTFRMAVACDPPPWADGRQDHPEKLGRAAARMLLDRGAGSLLR